MPLKTVWEVETGHDAPASAISTIVAQNTLLIFIAYFAAGLQAAVVPSFVTHNLQLGVTLAGFALSMQPLATLASRASTGSFTNRFGPRQAVIYGLLLILLSGFCFAFARPSAKVHVVFAYVLLLLSRFMLGLGISWVSAAGGAWAVGRAGEANSSRIFVWSGVAAYGSLALGAPAGLWVQAHWSVAAIGLLLVPVSLFGLGLAARMPDIAQVSAAPLRLSVVFQRVLPYGIILGLAASGYGVFSAYITLYFQEQGWRGAALPLTICGLSSVAVRLLLGRWIDRYSVYCIVMISLGTELCGLGLLGVFANADVALLASGLIGAGFSLVFPALCVQTILSVGAGDRASAISVFTAFLEFSMAVSAPLAGLVITHSGFKLAFWAGFLVVALGFARLSSLSKRSATRD